MLITAGSLIDRKYRLTRQIGEGAMGVVWAAVNELTSREVALKLILRSTDDMRIRLLREARACGKLSHRNIIEVLDVGQTDTGDPFLVMPLLSGETLAAQLERHRRIEPAHAARIGRDIARALATAHGAGIIHRDLKPANVFLHQEAGSDGNVIKVLDFGVSKNLLSTEALATIVGGAVGSPAYMSPEQIRGDRDIDHRADIWSLGVLLFEMLTGERPFPGETPMVTQKVLAGEIPRVSKSLWRVDPALDSLVARCLERNRDLRVATAAELAKLLDGFTGSNKSAHPHVDSPEPPSSAPQEAAAPASGMQQYAMAPQPGASTSAYPAPPSSYPTPSSYSAPPSSGYPPPSSGYPAPSSGYPESGSRAGSLQPMADPDEEIATVPVNLNMLGNMKRGLVPPAPRPPAQNISPAAPFAAPDTARPPQRSISQTSMPAIAPQNTSTEPLGVGPIAQWRASSPAPGTGDPLASAASPPSLSTPATMASALHTPSPLQGGQTLKMEPGMLPNVSPLPVVAPGRSSTTSSAAMVLLTPARPSHSARTGSSAMAERLSGERWEGKRLMAIVGAASTLVVAAVLLGVLGSESGPKDASGATPDAVSAAFMATGAPVTGAALVAGAAATATPPAPPPPQIQSTPAAEKTAAPRAATAATRSQTPVTLSPKPKANPTPSPIKPRPVQTVAHTSPLPKCGGVLIKKNCR